MSSTMTEDEAISYVRERPGATGEVLIRVIDRLTAERDELRAALKTAVNIARGMEGEMTHDAAQKLRDLVNLADR